jgi:hypothetical protein
MLSLGLVVWVGCASGRGAREASGHIKAYIEAHQSLRDHRKILALAAELDMAELDMAEPHVAGHCMFLWMWALDNAEEGVLPASARIIERVVGWVGASGALVAAMVSAGLPERDDTGALHIHDWWSYAGRLIEKRSDCSGGRCIERAPSVVWWFALRQRARLNMPSSWRLDRRLWRWCASKSSTQVGMLCDSGDAVLVRLHGNHGSLSGVRSHEHWDLQYRGSDMGMAGYI